MLRSERQHVLEGALSGDSRVLVIWPFGMHGQVPAETEEDVLWCLIWNKGNVAGRKPQD
jgi:hypothetical protein